MSRHVHPVLYVSGPVTGIEDDNRPAFEEAARRLRAAGFAARIPHEDIAPGTDWIPAMRMSLMAILAQADGLALLPGWERSKGACVEVYVARTLGMPVKPVDAWILGDEGAS